MTSKRKVKKKPTARSKATAPQSESIASRVFAALALIALGILLFLSVYLRMEGYIFSVLRSLSFGLSGSFAFLLPLFPLWAGFALLYPRPGSARTPLYLFVFYLLLLSCAMLFTYTSDSVLGRVSLMRYLALHTSTYGGFSDMLSLAYTFCGSGVNGYAGGLMGTLVAWPLWKGLGNDLAGVVNIVLLCVTLILFLRIDVPATIQKLVSRIRQRSIDLKQRQAELQREELARQKEQMMRTAQRQAFAGQPSPSQFSGQHPVVKPVADVSGFSKTPEESPDYRPAPKEARRFSISRIFGGSKEDETSEPIQELAQETPSPVPFSPETTWQASNMQSPFQLPPQVPDPVPHPEQPGEAQGELINPYHHTGLNTPAAAYPNPPEVLPVYIDPDSADTTEKPKRSRRAGQRTPTAWEGEALETVTPIDLGTEDEAAAASTPDPDENMPSPAQLAQPLASWTDGPSDSHQPNRTASGPGEVRMPPAPKNTPSTWQPDLHIQDPQGRPTYGDSLDGSDPVPDKPDVPPYIFPDPSLLRDPDAHAGFSAEEDAERSRRLEETLSSFKVSCKVKHVTHGPAISRFELELAQGIKVSKVTDLGPNIAMNMAVKSVRIEAPIPGTSLVGVEVPNRKVSLVTLREVLSSEKMVKTKDPLVVALGRDIAGTPVVCNIAKMPHLLIAGATGSGKSVCINTIIGSLLYRTSPEDVRLILVDPKVVELQCYNGIPHLLAPVVSDPHKASGALQWAVDEMMRRYAAFQELGVRNIGGYNEKLAAEGRKMPRIVIIIDELADLMMTCKREVEESICRIAQLARAAGIHLIVATQRPSVDVITGLIKANIPSRIAFKVSSFIDSRTILDKNGAEQLLGNGDMLYQPMGEFTPVRVQGCFLSDDEVNAITDFIRKTSGPAYDQEFVGQLSKIETESSFSAPDLETAPDTSGDSDLLHQCIEIALMDGQVSTSLLQRRLKIGYARAGRLVDEMEKHGIISAKDGAKPRLCLITREEYEQMKRSGAFAG